MHQRVSFIQSVLYPLHSLCVYLYSDTTGGSNSLNIDISSLLAGQHTLVVTGTDNYGNTATSTTQFNIRKSYISCLHFSTVLYNIKLELYYVGKIHVHVETLCLSITL